MEDFELYAGLTKSRFMQDELSVVEGSPLSGHA